MVHSGWPTSTICSSFAPSVSKLRSSRSCLSTSGSTSCASSMTSTGASPHRYERCQKVLQRPHQLIARWRAVQRNLLTRADDAKVSENVQEQVVERDARIEHNRRAGSRLEFLNQRSAQRCCPGASRAGDDNEPLALPQCPPDFIEHRGVRVPHVQRISICDRPSSSLRKYAAQASSSSSRVMFGWIPR